MVAAKLPLTAIEDGLVPRGVLRGRGSTCGSTLGHGWQLRRQQMLKITFTNLVEFIDCLKLFQFTKLKTKLRTIFINAFSSMPGHPQPPFLLLVWSFVAEIWNKSKNNSFFWPQRQFCKRHTTPRKKERCSLEMDNRIK